MGDRKMKKIRWKIITFKPWRFLFFKLRKIEEINENHTRYVYSPRTLKDIIKR